MALGDYVSTFAGAVAKGAQAIVASILQRGGTGTEAGAALRQTFQSLPGNIIGSLISQSYRLLAAGQTVFRGGALSGNAPLVILPSLPNARQVKVRVQVTRAGEVLVTTDHLVNLMAGETNADAIAAARKTAESVVYSDQYPDLGDALEENAEEDLSVEATITEVRERAGG